MSIGDISKVFNKLDRADTTRLHAITAGIPELAAQYNDNLTYEENLRNFLTAGSMYIKFMEETMAMTFRTPESYNTLLYAISKGKTVSHYVPANTYIKLRKAYLILRLIISITSTDRLAVMILIS